MQIMTPEEMDPLYVGRMNLIDSESLDIQDIKNMKMKIDRSSQMAYEKALEEIHNSITTFANSRGVAFISVCTNQPIEKVLFKELLKVGIMA